MKSNYHWYSKHWIKLFFISGFLLSNMALAPITASALSGSEFRPGRIIDDSVFFNPGSMSQQQIQDFLNAKVPTCDTNGTQSYNGTTRAAYAASRGYPAPFTCLKDYRQDTNNKSAETGLCNGHTGGSNKTSAQIIYEVAQSCGISPKVLLVLLEKEQALVTDDWPWSIQYRSATGYGCPDTAPCDAEYYGFFNQVYNAARQFKKYARDADQYSYRANRNNSVQYNPETSCGSSTVYIENPSSAGLYIYTPYQPNAAALNNLYGTGDSCSAYGNRNFWRLFNDWFGTTIVGSYPSPLYRSSTSGMIYAVVDAKKYYIPSFNIMVNYGFHLLPIASVSDSYLNTIANGTTLTNVGRKEYDPNGTIFFLDDGKEYAIKSPEQCNDWAIDCFNPSVAKVLPNNLFDRYLKWGGYLPDTVYNGGNLYKLSAGKRLPLIGQYTMAAYGGELAAAKLKDHNVYQPIGKAQIDDRYVIKFGDNPTIYLHDRGYLHPINNMTDFADWGLGSLQGSNVSGAFDTVPLARGPALSPLVKSYDGKMYIVAGGKKYPLLTRMSDFNDLPATVFIYPDSQADRLPSATLPDVLRAEQSGEIFTVTNKKKRVFASMDDLRNLGFNPNSMMNIGQSLANNLGYDGVNLARGRLFKVAGTNEIRLRHNDGYLYVGRPDYPTLNYNSTLNVDSQTGNLYPYLGVYTP